MADSKATDAGLLPLPAGSSTAGRLARQVIVGRDLSAIPPLLDALQDAGQTEERKGVLFNVGMLLGNTGIYDSMSGSAFGVPLSHAEALHRRWSQFVDGLSRILFTDIYDLSASLADLADQFAANPYTPPTRGDGTGGNYLRSTLSNATRHVVRRTMDEATTVDGVRLEPGESYLEIPGDQPAENGVYEVTADGAPQDVTRFPEVTANDVRD